MEVSEFENEDKLAGLAMKPAVEGATFEAGELRLSENEVAIETFISDSSQNRLVTRESSEDGSETMVVHQRVCFQLQQQRAVVHVPIVPSLANIPFVAGELIDGTAARVRVTDRQAFGTRVELILAQPCLEDTELLLELKITSGPPSDSKSVRRFVKN